jgi:hypothetical protein
MAGVRTTHPDYDAYAPKWKRCRDVIAGQDAMHAAKTAYLPKLKDESDGTGGKPDDNDYGARLKRSDFFNATRLTIEVLSGLVFRQSPTKDVPSGIEQHLEDVTLTGVPIEDFAETCITERLSVGPVGILVDHPSPPENVAVLTVDAAQRLGLRPTLQTYAAESVRNWKKQRINNAWVYSQVVLGEKHANEKSEFETEYVDRYRVLDLDEAGFYRQRVFEVIEGKDVIVEGPLYPLMNGRKLTYIPFKLDGDLDDPPLLDLVNKNVAHYQVWSDYRHGGHYTALPLLFITGMQEENSSIHIGGSAAIVLSDPQSKVGYAKVEDGFTALENQIASLERHMSRSGARMIAEETDRIETATASNRKYQGENSILGKIVKSTSRTLEWALGVFSEWAGQKSAKIVYQLNRDFAPAIMDALTLNAIFAGVQSGNISKQEAFVLLQRGDVIDGDVDYEAHQEQIKADGPPAPVKPAIPGAAAA